MASETIAASCGVHGKVGWAALTWPAQQPRHAASGRSTRTTRSRHGKLLFVLPSCCIIRSVSVSCHEESCPSDALVVLKAPGNCSSSAVTLAGLLPGPGTLAGCLEPPAPLPELEAWVQTLAQAEGRSVGPPEAALRWCR